MHILTDYQFWELERIIKKDPNQFDEVLLKDAALAKRVTWLLVTNGLLFNKINYGCGVVLFIKNNNIMTCRHCGGKGTIPKEEECYEPFNHDSKQIFEP